MSAYDNIVGGKLKLKGKALDVKEGGVKKKKKKKQQQLEEEAPKATENEVAEGESTEAEKQNEEDAAEKSNEEEKKRHRDKHLTPAERRYIEQKARLDVNRLAKEANKSHRDRIQDFNQYLANMSEHYDIPKVGPG